MHAETNRRVTTRALAFRAPCTRPAAGVVPILKRIWADWRARRALEALPDDILRDIGLSRADVTRETLQAFWNPLDYECLEAQRRRAASRR